MARDNTDKVGMRQGLPDVAEIATAKDGQVNDLSAQSGHDPRAQIGQAPAVAEQRQQLGNDHADLANEVSDMRPLSSTVLMGVDLGRKSFWLSN